jgi:hypothetical protein
MLRKDDEQDDETPLQKVWCNMMAQRAIDGPIPRSLTDLQRMNESSLFRNSGPEYSNYLDETLPPDDLTSQPSASYLLTTLESPKQHDVNDIFRVPTLPTTADAVPSRSGLPPRQLVVLDLNGSLLLRGKGRREVGGMGKIYSMMRRPYVGCLAKYLAHERTQSAVIVEHRPHKKVHHILPPDFDINWLNGKSNKKKKKKKNHSAVARDPQIETLLQLRQKIKANPDKFTLMCPLDAMVWSSVQAQNLPLMIDAAFGAEQTALRACWTRKMLRLNDDGYRSKVQTTKNLETIWWSSEGAYTARSTILIDDTAKKARLQPWNLLQIPEYTPASKGEWDPTGARGDYWPKDDETLGETGVDSDVTLLAVIGVLEELRNHSNIPAWIQGGHLLSSVHMQMDRERSEESKTDSEDNGTAGDAATLDEEEKPLWCSDTEVLAHWVKRGKSALASRGIPVDVGLLNVAKDDSFKCLRQPVY